MAKKIIVVRVDQGETQIVHMEQGTSNPTVYGCIRFPTPENAVQDGMIVDMMELASSIRRACVDKGIRTNEVIFTIASNKIASRDVSIPVVNKAKIEPLVMAKIPDLFPIDTEKYVFSYIMQGTPRKNEDGDDIQDVMVYAAPSDLVQSYYSLADAAGLQIVALEADGNAVFQIMKRRVKDKVSMSVQLDASSSLITIIRDNRLLLQRIIPYGFNVFTEVMMGETAFQTATEDEAYDLLKRNRVLVSHMNDENPQDDISLEKRIEVTNNASFLIGNIARVIEYYNTKYKDQPIEEIICMGQGCAIAGIHELMTNELGIYTFAPEEIVGIRFTRNVNINASILQYINCFGAVFEPVNFLPASQKSQKGDSILGGLLVFGSCILLAIVVNGFSLLQYFNTKEENELLKSRVAALTPVQSEFDALTEIEKNRVLMDAVSYYITTNNNGFHNLLKKIESYVPKTFKIQNITSDEDHVTISAKSADKLLSLSALQIQLNKIPEIKNVKLDSITQTNETMTKQKQYTYTLSFDYVARPVTAGETQQDTQQNTQQDAQQAAQGEEGEQP